MNCDCIQIIPRQRLVLCQNLVFSVQRRVGWNFAWIYQIKLRQSGGGSWYTSTLDSYTFNYLRGYKFSSGGLVWSQR